MRRRGFVGAAALTVAGFSGCLTFESVSRTDTHEFDVPADVPVRVDNQVGDVTVEPGDEGPVVVRAEKNDGLGNEDALDTLSVTSDRTDEAFEVTVLDERDDGLIQATTLELILAVPPETEVTGVEVDDGDVDVTGGGSDLSVTAEDGDVQVRNRDGEVTVHAHDGHTSVTGVAGDVSVDVEDGDVEVSDVEGFVEVTYEDGDVAVENVGGLDGVAGADGDATVVVPAVRGRATVQTADGDLSLGLATDLDARLVVETDNGDVEANGFGDRLDVAGDVDRFATTLGDGEHTLHVETDDGDVTIGPLE